MSLPVVDPASFAWVLDLLQSETATMLLVLGLFFLMFLAFLFLPPIVGRRRNPMKWE